ncbi:MAG: radical SAM protein, partial [Candidatus Bathyarchaeota archaeon]|nr:radical SAM protein [Candidatus Bathyarchaeota archaeon]
YIADCYRIAASKGLYRNLNTNCYMTPEALDVLIEAGMDSLCVDVKGDEAFYRRFCNGANPEPVWRNAAKAKRRGLHVEMVNLVVPGANDGEQCMDGVIARTRDELGRNTPLHLTRFYPAYRAKEYGLDSVTPIQTLEWARDRALGEGLEYVYTGNIPGHAGEDTYCPGCGRLLIDRYSFSVLGYHITDDGRCPSCGIKIPVVGKLKV